MVFMLKISQIARRLRNLIGLRTDTMESTRSTSRCLEHKTRMIEILGQFIAVVEFVAAGSQKSQNPRMFGKLR
jgi:hypothetical protein